MDIDKFRSLVEEFGNIEFLCGEFEYDEDKARFDCGYDALLNESRRLKSLILSAYSDAEEYRGNS